MAQEKAKKLALGSELQKAAKADIVMPRYSVVRSFSVKSTKECAELYQNNYLNADNVMEKFTGSSAFDEVGPDYMEPIRRFFMLSALHPEGSVFYRADMWRTMETKLKMDQDLSTEEKDAFRDQLKKINIRACAEKYAQELKEDTDFDWEPDNNIDSMRILNAFQKKFTNAEDVLMQFSTDTHFTTNYQGTTYTPVFIKNFMLTAINPDNFDANYQSMVDEFHKNGVEEYPSKAKMHRIMFGFLDQLEENPQEQNTPEQELFERPESL